MNAYILPNSEIALRLLTAAVTGSLVGWERQRKAGAAGLRTHMLVCLGSALIMIVSAFGFEDILGHPNVVLDPSRIAAQVVSGIGFLGAGTILFLRQQVVKGLTTAAGLWSVAGVGLAIGGGMYMAGIIATVIIVTILAIIKPLEQRIFKKSNVKTIFLTIDLAVIGLSDVENIIKSKGLSALETTIQNTEEPGAYNMKLTFDSGIDETGLIAMVQEFNNKNGITKLTINL